jgi:lipopolysaccharide transport system ATP-binding protein
LAFAVIAHVDADILIVDEALAVGDAFFTQKCMRFLRDFMDDGTIFFVSHDTATIRSLCTHAIRLDSGRCVEYGDPKDVCEHYLESFYEAQQGESCVDKFDDVQMSKVKSLKDQRDDFINSSNVRNDIKIFSFDPKASSFGKGAAQIVSVVMLNRAGNALSWIVGGEDVVLRVDVDVYKDLYQPLIGFFVKDRLGQCLFGDNTYLSYVDNPIHATRGGSLRAEFSFQMPRLASGDYAVTVAIAEGDQVEHVQHHWVHDAIIFRSESTSVASGIIGIPIQKIYLESIS